MPTLGQHTELVADAIWYNQTSDMPQETFEGIRKGCEDTKKGIMEAHGLTEDKQITKLPRDTELTGGALEAHLRVRQLYFSLTPSDTRE
jgi:hypothetical protein